MAIRTKLPIGIENFKEIRTQGYYYIDKTGMIKDLLENLGKVHLFTRPRRFGKTLNMSMLKYFFETGSDSALFDGLDISNEKQLCEEYMGKFPVISITLKGAVGGNFAEAKGMLRRIIGKEAMRFQFLMQSDRLSETERNQYEALVNTNKTGAFTMSDELLKDSLQILSQFLQKHYGQNVVILMDEYDVPLDKAYQSNYYDAMVELIRSLFGNAFKTNDSLNFAVLTGCLRISKESNVSAIAETSEKRLKRFSQTSPLGDVLFTGLNNFCVYTVKDVQYNEYFGFTDKEVREMLEYYGFMEKYDTVREWYDGYHFGELDIYCPWDVVSYCHALKMNASVEPQNYWVNTSGNDIIRSFLGRAGATTRNEIEQLINGGSVRKMIHQELTYRDLDSKPDNLWSILFTTGYLTQSGAETGELTGLVIPNKEIQWIFVQQIREWFREQTTRNTDKLERFCRAFQENDATAVEKGFNDYLGEMISIRDTGVRKGMKENFYHGLLLGILGHMDEWIVQSNAEAGDGYSDISIEIRRREIGIVIELKYAENGAFEDGCKEAMRQIKDRRYEEALIKEGMHTIYRFGIACYRKQCRVVSEKREA
ncbi:MAG: ATP-binding protein [Lachnospiraceae bacterium]|nr:ATP-binding protein [Lachnospiraceae bacterium]